MDFVMGIREKEVLDINRLCRKAGDAGAAVRIQGMIHSIRRMGGFSFVVIRRYDGILQCVLEDGMLMETRAGRAEGGDSGREPADTDLAEGMTVELGGIVRREERAPQGAELLVQSVKVLGMPEEGSRMPLPISKWKMGASLETKLALRPIALRQLQERAVFRIQEGIVRGFRDFLHSQSFTEIRTPKLVEGNAEGGANVFSLEYFGKRAFLAQSPQFYKQMMVGVYDRVFEAAPVFRAEKHNTARHLNEYTSLDMEMGYIDSFYEVMEMEQAVLQAVFGLLQKEYSGELGMLQVQLPEISRIPAVRFEEAKQLVSAKYGRPVKDPYDLEPEEEQLIGRYVKEEYGSDLVFVTHYPSKKRPFYAMDDPQDARYTLSFDLLYKGLEITTGGQRIHCYRDQVDKLRKRGMDTADFTDYLLIHKHGMPPHGGLGIGLERLTMCLLDRRNVRETALFPRDVTRLAP